MVNTENLVKPAQLNPLGSWVIMGSGKLAASGGEQVGVLGAARIRD